MRGEESEQHLTVRVLKFQEQGVGYGMHTRRF